MKFAKRLSALALALSLCGAAALPAYAHDVPDETRTGSVAFAMAYDGAAVGGGSLTLYARTPELPEAEPMDAMLLTTETEEDKKKRTPRKIRIDGMKV